MRIIYTPPPPSVEIRLTDLSKYGERHCSLSLPSGSDIPVIYDNFAGGFIRADETLKLTDKSPHHLLIITNEHMFSYYPLLNF